mmetsp:Transcript_15954/g.25999  ORF Transcript_15954/g.25999 Transcript_15954/m.25999 type:complete len:113 (+) Transcript_15954:254-592(+)
MFNLIDTEDVRGIFAAIGKDAGDSVNLEEFKKIMSIKMNQSLGGSEVDRAFVMLKGASRDVISFEDLRRISKEIGEDLGDEELKQMMEAAGANANGDAIDLKKFTAVLNSSQ